MPIVWISCLLFRSLIWSTGIVQLEYWFLANDVYFRTSFKKETQLFFPTQINGANTCFSTVLFNI